MTMTTSIDGNTDTTKADAQTTQNNNAQDPFASYDTPVQTRRAQKGHLWRD